MLPLAAQFRAWCPSVIANLGGRRESQLEKRAASQRVAEQALSEAKQEADAKQAALAASRVEVQQLARKLQSQQVSCEA